MFALQPVLSFLGFLPDVIILVMCVSYLTKSKTSDAVLLLAGSITHIVVRIFFALVPYFSIVSDSGTDSMMGFYTFGNFLSLVGSILFCFGLVILIRKVISMLPGIRP
jgi:uncharacterized membrane protein